MGARGHGIRLPSLFRAIGVDFVKRLTQKMVGIRCDSRDIDTSGLIVAIFELLLPVSLADIDVDSLEITDHATWWFF